MIWMPCIPLGYSINFGSTVDQIDKSGMITHKEVMATLLNTTNETTPVYRTTEG